MDLEVLESYEGVKVVETGGGQLPSYILLPVEYTPDEKKLLADPRSLIKDIKGVMAELEKIKTSDEKENFLRDYITKQLSGAAVSDANKDSVVAAIMDELFLGYGKIGPLMRDDMLEEIMINSVRKPIYVVHRKHGMCETNLRYESREEFKKIMKWLSSYAGREISKDMPLMDTHMPDGSRVNVAIPPAAPYGPSITIRKFRKIPYTILDLIELGTVSRELAAFMWLCVEGMGLHPCDILVAGGAGSGKTTLLNALAMFIPKSERIVTVEDTLELNFSFIENWVPLEASSQAGDVGVLSMHSLVKNSLRMRPDRVIVGEVRGSEAETLLVAMDIGLDGSMGTIHANNARETTIRLMNAPMNVPPRMIPFIDLVVVANRIYDRKKGMRRRVTEVYEVSGVEKDVVQMGEVFLWNVNTDTINRSEYPILLKEKIARACGITVKRLNTELLIREKVLQYMIDSGIRENTAVINFIQRYNMEPKDVIDEIKSARTSSGSS